MIFQMSILYGITFFIVSVLATHYLRYVDRAHMRERARQCGYFLYKNLETRTNFDKTKKFRNLLSPILVLSDMFSGFYEGSTGLEPMVNIVTTKEICTQTDPIPPEIREVEIIKEIEVIKEIFVNKDETDCPTNGTMILRNNIIPQDEIIEKDKKEPIVETKNDAIIETDNEAIIKTNNEAIIETNNEVATETNNEKIIEKNNDVKIQNNKSEIN